MAAIVTNVTALVTAAISWLTSAVACVMDEGNELLLFFILIPMCGIFAGLLRRFVK